MQIGMTHLARMGMNAILPLLERYMTDKIFSLMILRQWGFGQL